MGARSLKLGGVKLEVRGKKESKALVLSLWGFDPEVRPTQSCGCQSKWSEQVATVSSAERVSP